MAGKNKKRRLSWTISFLVGLLVYGLFVRKRLLCWGTPEPEAQDRFPGDELVPEADLLTQTTRSVTIRATPADIWPWLLQLGQGRGGFYSYDWLENLFMLDIHNTDRILPEHQHLQVGDRIPFWKNAGVTVRSLEPERYLVLAGSLDPNFDQVGGSWSFRLEPLGSQVTHLVARARVVVFSPLWLSRAFSLFLLEPVHFIMERKMLLGIRERAEARRRPALVLDEILPEYDFTEIHRVTVDAPGEQVYQAMKALRAEELSPLIFTMLDLRRLPERLAKKGDYRAGLPEELPFLQQLYSGGFIPLADDPGRREVVFGLIGQFWKLSDGDSVQVDTPEAFRTFQETDFAKVAANLVVQEMGNQSLLSTETRIWAPDAATQRKFASYWRLISLGSGWIRILWLRAIKRRAENHKIQP